LTLEYVKRTGTGGPLRVPRNDGSLKNSKNRPKHLFQSYLNGSFAAAVQTNKRSVAEGEQEQQRTSTEKKNRIRRRRRRRRRRRFRSLNVSMNEPLEKHQNSPIYSNRCRRISFGKLA
jgi:hypothetical protein